MDELSPLQRMFAALRTVLAPLGCYEVKEKLSDGAFSDVFLLCDEDLGRNAVLKTPVPGNCLPERRSEVSRRFLSEARVLAELDHAAIVKVYHYGEMPVTEVWPEGWPYVILEYFGGGTLHDHREKQPRQVLKPHEAADLMAKVADALASAHAHSLLHRDLKPRNVFLDRAGHSRIGDWGLAVDWRDLRESRSGFAGTYEYASPEQIRGNTLDGRSDIWALGVILYELLVGERPFGGENALANICQAEYVPLRQHDATISPELERICHRCIQRLPGDRFLTASDLANRLRRWTVPRQRSKTRPFCVIEEVDNLFGSPNDLARFAPTEEEYREGHVHRPAVANDVEQRLLDEGWALVRGRGAAGKTVLALQIALAPKSRFSDTLVYYLNLQKSESESDIDNAPDLIGQLAQEDVLFVVDNIHLNEDLAARIYRRWEEKRAGSKLLMLGRLVTHGPNVRGVREPLSRLKEAELPLEVGRDELRGVFQRLAGRNAAQVVDIPEPPPEVLDRWLGFFGGDLIAFSSAIARRMPELRTGTWNLAAADAADYVRVTYLDDASDDERAALIHLSALAEIELPASSKVVKVDHIKRFVRAGLVFRNEHDVQHEVQFSLVHPGFGDLIWSAAGQTRARAEVRTDIARSDVRIALHMAFRLKRAGRDEDLIPVLDELAAQLGKLLQCLRPADLPRLVALFKLFDAHGVIVQPDLAKLIHTNRDAIIDAALGMHFGHSAWFLRFAQEHMPEVHSAMADTLITPVYHERLVEVVFRGDLGHLIHVLRHTREHMPEVHSGMADTLIALVYRERLVEMLFRGNLGDLVSFLRHTQEHAPQVCVEVADALGNSANRDLLAGLACRGSHHNLLLFERCTSDFKLDAVRTSLAAGLAMPPYARTVVAKVHDDRHDAIPLSAKCARALIRLNLPDLAAIVARTLVRMRGRGWKTSRRQASISHLAILLDLARDQGSDALRAFLDRRFGRGSLQGKYAKYSLRRLAYELFPLALSQDPEVLKWFCGAGLRERLLREGDNLGSSDPHVMSHFLRCLGSASLIGIHLPRRRRDWLNKGTVADVVAWQLAPRKFVQPDQRLIQLWLGLREAARLVDGLLAVLPESGERTLTLWQNARSEEARRRALDAEMIAWLKGCAAAGWTLLVEEKSIYELLHGGN